MLAVHAAARRTQPAALQWSKQLPILVSSGSAAVHDDCGTCSAAGCGQAQPDTVHTIDEQQDRPAQRWLPPGGPSASGGAQLDDGWSTATRLHNAPWLVHLRPLHTGNSSFASAAHCSLPQAAVAAPSAPCPQGSLCEPPVTHVYRPSDSALDGSGGVQGLPSSETLEITAFSPGELSLLAQVLQATANGYEAVHTWSGLPWVASIPLVTLVMRCVLLPSSLRQARVVRLNYALYKEAAALTEQQEREREVQELIEKTKQQRLALQQQEREQEQQRQQGEVRGAGAGSTPAGGAVVGRGDLSSTVTPTSSGKGNASSGSTVNSASRSGSDSSSSSSSSSSIRSIEERLRRSQAVYDNFHMLRAKLDVPHPLWILLNPAIQVPVFMLSSAALAAMCRSHWPGMQEEGALWFPDLTKAAYDMAAGQLVLGPEGLVLPLLIYGMTMTSLRIGVGASGVRAAQGLPDTSFRRFLLYLPAVLYTITTLNLYLKVQMAHAMLMHWLASSSFTLSFQMAIRHPAVRSALNLPGSAQQAAQQVHSAATASAPSDQASPSEGGRSASSSSSATAAASSSASSSSTQQAAESGGGSSSSSSSVGGAVTLPTNLLKTVEETKDPNILVIMGAQLSARQQYREARYCLEKAILLNPRHVRGHYALGQVHSLTGVWEDAELHYRAAAELAGSGPERGQALYCIATALHTQGKLEEAVPLYRDAAVAWEGQRVVVQYSLGMALANLGQLSEAQAVVEEALQADAATPGSPFAKALATLKGKLQAAVAARGRGTAGAGDGSAA